MVLYEIRWKNSAVRELKKLPKSVMKRILLETERLSSNPYPHGGRKIEGSDHSYRVRVGDYRIVYSVYSEVLMVEIIRVRHRKDVYKKIV